MPYWYVGRSLGRVQDQTFGKNAPWDMHSFRRTATAALSNAGVSENARKLVIGHSTKEDIGFDIYAKKGELWGLIESTMRTLYAELGGSLLDKWHDE